MANAADSFCRLCLVTPPDYEIVALARALTAALAGGDVASLIVTAPSSDPANLQRAAETFVPIAAAREVAVLIHNSMQIAHRAKADGVHVDSGIADLRAAREASRGRIIVGAGGVASRHEALEAGAAEPDYIFFGRLDGDTDPEIHGKSLDLAAWWSSVTVIPAIIMGGNTTASVEEAARSGVDFVALSSAVWNHTRGPTAAVAEANEYLARTREIAA